VAIPRRALRAPPRSTCAFGRRVSISRVLEHIGRRHSPTSSQVTNKYNGACKALGMRSRARTALLATRGGDVPGGWTISRRSRKKDLRSLPATIRRVLTSCALSGESGGGVVNDLYVKPCDEPAAGMRWRSHPQRPSHSLALALRSMPSSREVSRGHRVAMEPHRSRTPSLTPRGTRPPRNRCRR